MRHGSGELVIDDLPPAPAGRVNQVWTRRDTQAPEPTRTLFTVPRDGDTRVTIDADLDGVRQVLVTDEPPGGSSAPTRPPLITGTLS